MKTAIKQLAVILALTIARFYILIASVIVLWNMANSNNKALNLFASFIGICMIVYLFMDLKQWRRAWDQRSK